MKYLAVLNHGETIALEDSYEAVKYAVLNGLEVDYYPVSVDPNTRVLTVGEKVTERAIVGANQSR